jgi:hypothetical protein
MQQEEKLRRSTRTDLSTLLEEARSLEVLAEATDVTPERLQDYWATAAELITSVIEIESLSEAEPFLTDVDARVVDLRHRLRLIAARLIELSPD